MSNILSPLEIRKKYRQFRILVIGRTGAGKTTLLKRVCNSTEDPCIYDEKNQNLLEPNSGRETHDIHRPFVFKNYPQFIFHEAPGIEAGDDCQLKEIQSFITEFCFKPDISRPLLGPEQKFFNEAGAGNVPVIAIYMKFDDLIVQVLDREKKLEENKRAAERELKDKFEIPLSGYKFPPKAHVRVQYLNDDDSDHQNQVKELMTKTADSLDDATLELLYASVRQNKLELSFVDDLI